MRIQTSFDRCGLPSSPYCTLQSRKNPRLSLLFELLTELAVLMSALCLYLLFPEEIGLS